MTNLYSELAEKSAHQETRAYGEDIMGKYPHSHVNKRNTAIQSYVETFFNLEPSAPIRMTRFQLDKICLACVIGDHCYLPKISSEDEVAIQDFLKIAQWVGFSENEDYFIEYNGSTIFALQTTKEKALFIVSQIEIFEP